MILLRLLLSLSLSVLTLAQASPDKDKIWQDFIGWMKAQRTLADLGQDKYRASLIQGGLSAAQADERMKLLEPILTERRSELGPIYFDKLYNTPDQTRFTLKPNAFLVETAKRLKPGKALDVAMGQGRNAVYLAVQGWDVTGYDLADDGMRIARENAAKLGAKIHTVHSSFEDFDYGQEKWDLIYFVYTDAPVVDPKFAERIVAALKPGGHLLIDRPFQNLENPEPGWGPIIEQDKPNALIKAYPSLRVMHYQDTMEIADWQQTQDKREEKLLRIVRILAKKQ